MKNLFVVLLIMCSGVLVACESGATPQVFQATIPADDAPIAPQYTETPIPTLTPLVSATPSQTATASPTLTATASATSSFTPTPINTPTITPTQSLVTLTAPQPIGMPSAFQHQPASFSPTEGWDCGEFPCEGDIDGFMSRIRVPDGYVLEFIGRFPGQPVQIAYGADQRLYATVLENGTRSGAVYVMNADATTQRYSDDLISPVGLAFQPGTNTLYVSARLTTSQGGGIYEIAPDGQMTLAVNGLPCCFNQIDGQPNGMIFGIDGFLYVGVGALTDRLEPVDSRFEQYATLNEYEASILRVNPHTGTFEVFARGIRNPFDLTMTADGQIIATDNGLVTGQGDRLLRVDSGAHYGWPHWRTRGCADCPPLDPALTISADFVRLPNYTLPRGIVAYTGTQFPENLWDDLFVSLWHNRDEGQRIVRIDPDSVPADPTAPYTPEPFVTGLIRPADVIVAPDGTLVIADFIYGHVWRVRYAGG